MSDRYILKVGPSWAVSGSSGDINSNHGPLEGVYYRDTRILRQFELRIAGHNLTRVSASEDKPGELHVILTNEALTLPDGARLPKASIEIVRGKIISSGAYLENILIANHAPKAVRLPVDIYFTFSFADTAEVVGVFPRHLHRDIRLTPDGDSRILASYAAADHDYMDSALIAFSEPPDVLGQRWANYLVLLDPGETFELEVSVIPRASKAKKEELTYCACVEDCQANYERWMAATTQILTDNPAVNRLLKRCTVDLWSLYTEEDGEKSFFASGLPDSNALYGRSALISSLEYLASRPSVVRTTLNALASYQGTEVNEATGEEPGKMPYEVRSGERCREADFATAYGSPEATLIFPFVAYAYFAWTHDQEFLREIIDPVVKCLEWAREFGERDGLAIYRKPLADYILNPDYREIASESVTWFEEDAPAFPVAMIDHQAYYYATLTRSAKRRAC